MRSLLMLFECLELWFVLIKKQRDIEESIRDLLAFELHESGNFSHFSLRLQMEPASKPTIQLCVVTCTMHTFGVLRGPTHLNLWTYRGQSRTKL